MTIQTATSGSLGNEPFGSRPEPGTYRIGSFLLLPHGEVPEGRARSVQDTATPVQSKASAEGPSGRYEERPTQLLPDSGVRRRNLTAVPISYPEDVTITVVGQFTWSFSAQDKPNAQRKGPGNMLSTSVDEVVEGDIMLMLCSKGDPDTYGKMGHEAGMTLFDGW